MVLKVPNLDLSVYVEETGKEVGIAFRFDITTAAT